MKKLFIFLSIVFNTHVYAQEISLDEYAQQWHNDYVTPLNDYDKTLLANMFYLCTVTTAVDINTKRLLHSMHTNLHVVKNAVKENEETHQEALDYLQKDALQLSTLVQGHSITLKTWQQAVEWINKNGSHDLHNALNVIQQQLQLIMQTFVQTKMSDINAIYTTARDEACVSHQLSGQAHGFYQALLNNENPVRSDNNKELQPIMDINTAIKISTAKEQQAYRDIQTSQHIEAIALTLQEISHIFYKNLYNVIISQSETTKFVALFNVHGLISDSEQTIYLEPLN